MLRICFAPWRGQAQPRGNVGCAVQELWWPQSSAAVWQGGAWTALLQVFPGPAVPLLWAFRGRCWPSSPTPASPRHGFGISHLYGSHFPGPEAQPGLVEADQKYFSAPLKIDDTIWGRFHKDEAVQKQSICAPAPGSSPAACQLFLSSARSPLILRLLLWKRRPAGDPASFYSPECASEVARLRCPHTLRYRQWPSGRG